MLVTMSEKELNRLNVIQSVCDKRLRRRDAAHQLDISERQVQRLMNRYRQSGAAGITSSKRGQPSNHRLPESFRVRVLLLLHEKYQDFGPTLAAEKLLEKHGLSVSVETLRSWMLASGRFYIDLCPFSTPLSSKINNIPLPSPFWQITPSALVLSVMP